LQLYYKTGRNKDCIDKTSEDKIKSKHHILKVIIQYARIKTGTNQDEKGQTEETYTTNTNTNNVVLNDLQNSFNLFNPKKPLNILTNTDFRNV
jgi:hypothetical protein